MTVDEAAAVRLRLSRVGLRRQQIQEQERKLREDTRTALRAAKGVIPVSEAARLAQLNRSTVYELYLGDENATSTHDGPSTGQRSEAVAG